MVLEEITQTRDYTGTFKEGTERCARQNEINNKIIEEVIFSKISFFNTSTNR